MIFFGWGRRSKTADLDPGRVLMRVWGHFHVFWLFRFSWPAGYQLATATESGWAHQPISNEEGRALDPEGRANVHWWWRFGILLPVAGIVFSLIIATLYPEG